MRVTNFILILIVAMATMVFPAHAQVDFDLICFIKCATSCVPHPDLKCFSKCIKKCNKPAPLPPAPKPPKPKPPKPGPPKPPPVSAFAPEMSAFAPEMSAFPPEASEGIMKSCNLLCAAQECAGIDTDTEKLKCLDSCSKVACEDEY